MEDFNNDGRTDYLFSAYSGTSVYIMTNGVFYYIKSASSSNVQNTASWSSALDGSGSVPPDFNAGKYFVLDNSSGTTSFSIAGNWTFTGNLSIPSGKTLATGTYSFVNNGTLANSGTITSSSGNTTFSGSSAQTLSGTGTYGNLIVNNSSGVSLGGNTAVIGTLTLTSGMVDINNFTLTAGTIAGAAPGRYIRTGGNGKLEISIANGTSKDFAVGNSAYNPVTITNNSGASDLFSVKVVDAVYQNGADGASLTYPHITRTWDISKTAANGGSGINVVFNWNAGETSAAITNPYMFHYENSRWVKQTGSSSNTATSFTYTGYTGTFSPFAIADEMFTLPADGLLLAGMPGRNRVLLNWFTLSEQNTATFELQHSSNRTDWLPVTTVTAAGSSNQRSDYSATHFSPVSGINYYRLLVTDIDGKNRYSNVVAIKYGSNSEVFVYPNPASGNMTVAVPAGVSNDAVLMLADMSGHIVKQQTGFTNNRATVEMNQLASGIYIVKVIDNGKTYQLVVNKR